MEIKTTGRIPKTLLAACQKLSEMVEMVDNEGEDGYWVHLRDGYVYEVEGTAAIHEWKVRAAIHELQYIRKL